MTGISAMLGMMNSELLSVSTSPPFSAAGRKLAGAGPYNTPAVTAIVAGGSGTYTYAWTILPGSDDTMTIAAPTSATTSFGFTVVVYVASGTARLTVTDTTTGAIGHADVAVSYTLYGG